MSRGFLKENEKSPPEAGESSRDRKLLPPHEIAPKGYDALTSSVGNLMPDESIRSPAFVRSTYSFCT